MRQKVKKAAIKKGFSSFFYITTLGSWAAFMSLTTIRRLLFMKKEDIFKDVLLAVSAATGLSEEEIKKSKTEECTDARFILVRYLDKLIPTSSIAALLGRSKPGIRSILSRQSADPFWVESNWKEIVKLLESKYFVKA